ncbi:DUF4011 domain-containing protein [Curtobacterium sp. 20TX0008]|uniref:DUF4011 domain-containing protein n=1 Tax=Curtobacterium sp. 20TX0008 TaxID=3022018 RepID=UPI00232A9EA7|nr:DUF3320 domain-containing protein [Curtobacterium sp. 20TX0008]MDB6427302.1 DUF3320 domain-containing protein [Curtobacterium sp. 20TX0008]
MTSKGFAVVDLETTGLSPKTGHRVIEIAVVLVDERGRIEREFETVVNPNRDLGPTHIHRLRGADVIGAPTFADIVGDLTDLFQGRTLVAHNVRFEVSFLQAEFARAGAPFPCTTDNSVCTMRLASTFLPGAARNLADCCSAFDIDLVDAHEALADARATARLLGAYMQDPAEDRRRWDERLETGVTLTWGRPRASGPKWLPRRRASAAPATSAMDRAVEFLPASTDHTEQEYLALVDRAVADGFLTIDESSALDDLAEHLAMPADQRARLHQEYVHTLAHAALRDGVLDPSERAQVDRVAELLRVPSDVVRAALAGSAGSPTQFGTPAAERPLQLDAATIVVLTGEMRRPRADIEGELRALGVTVGAAVTKKTTLLVAADPDSLSGKARKARQYGVPMIDEATLDSALLSARASDDGGSWQGESVSAGVSVQPSAAPEAPFTEPRSRPAREDAAMTNGPEDVEYVGAALRVAVAGLQPFVSDVLQPRISSGARWPQLIQLLDQQKHGRSNTQYDEHDLQVVLRALTEKLPQLGFPFDLDHNGRRLAGELRDVRNRWAHNAVFDEADTYRALDTTVRLLEAVGADERAAEATELRRTFQSSMAERTATRTNTASVEATHAASATDSASAASASGAAGTATRSTELVIECAPLISYAMAHNRIAVVNAVRIRHDGANVRDARLTIEVSSAGLSLGEPREHFFDLAPQSEIEKHDLGFRLDPAVTATVEAARPAVVTATLRDGDELLATTAAEVHLVAAHQWVDGGTQLSEEMLAAHVQPNHPALTSLLDEASTILAAETGRGSLSGYQEGPERVDETVAAIVRAMRDRQVRYSMPPASWAGAGQQVRTPAEVLEGRFGTCLDTTVVLAAALEWAGIRPLLIVMRRHAFLAYTRFDTPMPSLVSPGVTLKNLVDIGAVTPIETTMLTTDGSAASLADVIAAGARHLSEELHDIQGVVDVFLARRSEILPLPARTVTEDGEVRVVEYQVEHARLAEYVPADSGAATESAEDSTPPRVKQWKNNLLDLSLRNRLINFTDRARFELYLASNGLAEFEDYLNSGRPFTIRASNDLPEVLLQRGVRSAASLPDDDKTELFRGNKTVYGDVSVDRYSRHFQTLAHKAKTVVEETGSNNLYVALGSMVWTVKSKQVRSPLILVPVTLKARTRGGAYEVVLDESGMSTPNYCLLEKIWAEHRIRIPALADPKSDASGIDVEQVLAGTRAAIIRAGIDAVVEPTVDLAILQFAKFRLWKDLDENWAALSTNPLVQHLIESPTERFVGDQVDLEHASAGTDELDELLSDLPVPADSSQLEAVAAAMAGRTFVLEGPPGTGKSQTITNLLAKSIADGRRVLFVAEKRAALQVVQRRLDAVGLAPFTLDLHDKGAKPAEVRARLREALAQRPRVDHEAVVRTGDAVSQNRRGLSRYARRLHETNESGRSFYMARNSELATADITRTLEIPVDVAARITESDINSIRRALREAPDVALRARPVADHPWAFASAGTDPEVLRARAVEFDRVVDMVPARDDPTLGSYAEALTNATRPEHFRALASIVEAPPVAAAVLTEAGTQRWRDATAAVQDQVHTFSQRYADVLAVIRPESLRTDLAAIAREAATAATSSIFGRKKRLQSVADEVVPYTVPGVVIDPDRLVALTARAADMQQAARDLASSIAVIPGLVIRAGWSPLDQDARASLATEVRWLSWLADVTGGTSEDAEGRRFRRALFAYATRSGAPQPELRDQVVAFSSALEVLASSAAWLSWLGEELPILRWNATRDGRSGASRDGCTPEAWTDWLSVLEPLCAAGLHDAYEVLLTGSQGSEDALEAFDRGLATAMRLERARATGLDQFDPASHEHKIGRYVDAARDLREHLPRVIPEKVVTRRTFNETTASGGAGQFLAEVRSSKVRKLMPVRELMSRYGQYVTELTPCVLVSPDSVARFFEATPGLFDLVVFDEASQVRVADAIGAMGRAKAVVVVGDSKQMPPTSFAETSIDDSDDDENGAAEQVAVDEESILAQCVQARVDRFQLTWHYRSQDESLIAFSNRYYYDDQLTSFPAPALGEASAGVDGHGVSLRRVGGQFMRAGQEGTTRQNLRTNPVEARAIVAEIQRRFAASPDLVPSLGVVTFNAQQRSLVEELLRALEDPRINEALDSAVDGLFVKNLENVQGDERDTILFSTAFSKNSRGVLPLNFGPLTSPGGERRLNVAVTRARRQVVLFSSFDPQDLRADETTSLGIKHLRAYLELAQRGARAALGVRDDTILTDRHRDEIASELVARGLAVQTDVGLSDFKVDIAVAHPSNPTEPLLAVLLDTPAWAARATVADRDALPLEVLKNLMHWPSVRRVWMPQWLTDHGVVVDSIVDSLQKAHEERVVAADATTAVSTAIDDVLDELPGALASSEDPNGSTVDHSLPVSPIDFAARTDLFEPTPEPSDDPVDVRLDARAGGGGRDEPGTSRLHVSPASQVEQDAFTREVAAIGEVERFRPWSQADLYGDVSVLDAIDLPQNAARVQALLVEVVQAEGPIAEERLVRMVANSFGLDRVHAARAQAISALVPPMLRWSALERFVWPIGVDPEGWSGFRASTPQDSRPVEVVALREIGNAMVHLIRHGGPRSETSLLRETLALFGGTRMTQNVSDRMTMALMVALTSQRVARTAQGDVDLGRIADR